jgi:hypothetical protein
MKALFCVYHIDDTLTYGPTMQHHQHHHLRGTGSARTRRWARATCAVHAISGPPSLWGGLERTEGASTPPLMSIIRKENTKPKPASSGSALARSDDVDDDRAQLCARSRQNPPLGSPLRLPGMFQGAGGTGSAITRKGARTTSMVLTL